MKEIKDLGVKSTWNGHGVKEDGPKGDYHTGIYSQPLEYMLTDAAKVLEDTLNIDFTPFRKHSDDACFDLRVAQAAPVVLEPGQEHIIPTGIKVNLGSLLPAPDGHVYVLKVFPRSSNPGFILCNTVGIIDAGYHGEIMIRAQSRASETIKLEIGERFVQASIEVVKVTDFERVESFSNTSTRGSSGLGSTGR